MQRSLRAGEISGAILSIDNGIAVELATVAVETLGGEALPVDEALTALWEINTTESDVETFVAEETASVVDSLFGSADVIDLSNQEAQEIVAEIADAATDAIVSDGELNSAIESVLPEESATDIINSKTEVFKVTVSGPDGEVEVPMDALSFVAGSVVLVVEPVWSQTPGTYEIVIEITNPITGETETVVQNFSWGVVAMNFDQDRYDVGATTMIELGVLDETGAIVCDADLVLEVSGPDGVTETLTTDNGSITQSATCGELSNDVSADYTAIYSFDVPGTYTFALDAATENGAYSDVAFGSLTKEVTVGGVGEVTITREVPTRLFPSDLATVNIEVTGKPPKFSTPLLN